MASLKLYCLRGECIRQQTFHELCSLSRSLYERQLLSLLLLNMVLLLVIIFNSIKTAMRRECCGFYLLTSLYDHFRHYLFSWEE